MKKRIICAVLAVVMVVALAACASKTTGENSDVQIESSAALLNSVWSTFAEDEKFPVMGGDIDNNVNDEAGAINIGNVENTVATLHISEASLELVDEAGALTHAMNPNTFTAAAYHLKDAANTQTLVDSLKESIKNTQWMCGFPETLIIYTVNGDYVVAAFGNADAIESFKTKLATVYGDSATLNVEEALA